MHSCRWLKCSRLAQGTLFEPWEEELNVIRLSNTDVRALNMCERTTAAYLRAGHLFVLFPLGHFDWRQVCYSRYQEVHQDVLTVGGAIHQSPQRLGQVVGEQVMVVPVGEGGVSRASHFTG